jgi:hypothetical protein
MSNQGKRDIANTGGIPCNNETFSDPVVGVFKACYVTD